MKSKLLKYLIEINKKIREGSISSTSNRTVFNVFFFFSKINSFFYDILLCFFLTQFFIIKLFFRSFLNILFILPIYIGKIVMGVVILIIFKIYIYIYRLFLRYWKIFFF